MKGKSGLMWLFGAALLWVAQAAYSDTDHDPCSSSPSAKSCDSDDRDGSSGGGGESMERRQTSVFDRGVRLDLDEALVTWSLWSAPGGDRQALLLVRGNRTDDDLVIAREGSSIELRRGGEVLHRRLIDQHGGTLEAYVRADEGTTRIGMWENGRHVYSEKVPASARELVALGPVIAISR